MNNNPINRIDPLGLAFLDWVQGGLSVASFVPGLNIGTSGLNAVISLARGDLVGAAENAAGMIPGEKIAAAAYKGGKAAYTALKAEQAVVATEKAAVATEKAVVATEKVAVKAETKAATETAENGAESAGKAPEAPKSGVYHIETPDGKKYTGSGLDMDARMANPNHPAKDLLATPGVTVTKTPVDVSHLDKADKTRALRVVEQDTMDAVGNVPKTDGSVNKIRALTPQKQELYRPLLDKDK